LKQIHESGGNTLEQIDIGHDLLNRTQKTQHLREKNEHQAKELLHSKRNSDQTRDSPQNGRKSLAATHLMRD
jgi:hypothetical protein